VIPALVGKLLLLGQKGIVLNRLGLVALNLDPAGTADALPGRPAFSPAGGPPNTMALQQLQELARMPQAQFEAQERKKASVGGIEALRQAHKSAGRQARKQKKP